MTTTLFGSKLPHIRLYLKHFGEPETCEACDKYLNGCFDIHHIQARSMGGTKKPERIENLQCLCRECHVKFGDRKDWKSWLYKAHLKRLELSNKPFDEGWIREQIKRHEIH